MKANEGEGDSEASSEANSRAQTPSAEVKKLNTASSRLGLDCTTSSYITLS